MTADEQEALVKTLIATAQMMGTELSAEIAAAFAEDLDAFPLVDVQRALVRCRREHTGKLALKLVLDILSPSSGWVNANEAWAMALPAFDEAASVVWTPEIAKAWAVAKPIWDAGDKIGARMAFIPAYERLLSAAKMEDRPPAYQLSDGWDPALREQAVQKAVSVGLLPPPAPAPALPAPDISEEQQQENRERIAAGLRDLALRLSEAGRRNEEDRRRQREEAQRQFEARKAETVRQAMALDDESKREDS